MKKHFLLLSFLILSTFVFQSCTNGDKSANTATDSKTDSTKVANPYALAIETHSAKEDNCKTDECTYIDLRIPVLKGGDSIVCKAINSFTEDEIRESVKARLPEPMGNVSLDAMCESFIEGYKLFLIEFPDSEQKWYLTISGDSSIVGSDYFTTIINHNEYLGGAHGASFKQLHSFDLNTGNLIQMEDRFDMDLVKVEAEKRFRKANNLSPQASLDDAGFLFEDGIFTLPENMALTSAGLLLVYNSYEVASYAEGATEILIPYTVISAPV